MRKSLVVVLRLSALCCLFSTESQAWTFSEGKEDFGPSCVATSNESGAAKISIFSSKNDFNPLLLVEPYKDEYGAEFRVRLMFSNRHEVELPGYLSDYFGVVEASIGLNQIDDMLRSDSLVIILNNRDQQMIDLRGAGIPLRAFLRCARR